MSTPLVRPLTVLAIIASVLLTASWAGARDAVVTTKDGRKFTGELVSDNPEGVTLKISNISTLVPRAEIADVQYKQSVEEVYEQRRQELADDDYEGRYALAYWLFENEAYALTLRELDQLDPLLTGDDHREVLESSGRLRKAVEARLKLGQAPPPAIPDPAAPEVLDPEPVAEPGSPISAAISNLPRLDERQINLIRVYEADLSAQPNVVVPNDVVDDLLKNFADDDRTPKGLAAQRQFRAAKGWQKLQLIFDLRARRYYDRITVTSDPPLITDFRLAVHRNYVLNYCGTNQCHGGEHSGGFFLFRTPSNDQTLYTNYAILHQYSTQQAYMIDRASPVKSLLIQYGLPRASANFPHPEVPANKPRWRPHFSGTTDPKIERLRAWIGRIYTAPNNPYPIQFTPPTPFKSDPAATAPQVPAATDPGAATPVMPEK